MPPKLHSFGISDIGLLRSNNEDVWGIVSEKRFFVLADGMGGHNAGEVAALLTLQSMCSSIALLKAAPTTEEACQALRKAVAQANAKVLHEARRYAEYSGMGTTLSCFIVLEKALIYAHVGDSRVYRFRSALEQLTEDHSLYNTPLFKKEEGAAPARNVITRAIGAQPTIHPDIGVIPFNSKDIYMICSDGLSDYVEESRIARLLASPLPLEEKGKKLVAAALEKGGNDNITLLLVQVH